MRGNAEMHDLTAPGDLGAVLQLLAAEPGKWTPIAGGTELMVAFSAGRLNAPKLVSLWGIPDLRFIKEREETIAIGAATTFLDLRKNAAVAKDLPLLAKAASWRWSGGIPSWSSIRLMLSGMNGCSTVATTRRVSARMRSTIAMRGLSVRFSAQGAWRSM